MSITFNVDRPRITIGYAVTCYAYGSENNWRGPVQSSTDAAYADHRRAHQNEVDCDTPTDIHAYPVYDTDTDPTVCVSNVNGLRILEHLGLLNDNEDIPYFGRLSAEDFAGRLIVANALTPVDAGVPMTVTSGNGGSTIVDCGRTPNYLQDRFAQLELLVAFAREHNADIAWG